MTTPEDLRAIFDYDPSTGVVSRKLPVQRGRVGALAPKPRREGLRVRVRGTTYPLHRVVWAIHHGRWPDARLVFRNGNKTDTRIDNLVPASMSQTLCAAKLRSDNTSGAKGVSWHTKHRLWQATIGHDGRRIAIGWFREKEAAIAAVALKRTELHGAFARAA